MLSEDRQSALLGWDLTGDPVDGAAKLPAMTTIVDDVQRAHSEVTLEQAGGITLEKAIDDKLSSDFQKAEHLSIPITLIILVLAFGAFLAAGIPVLLSLSVRVRLDRPAGRRQPDHAGLRLRLDP